MNTILFILGSLSVFAGLALIYRPGWILKFNRFVRDHVVNDAALLLERRKKGVLMLLLAFLFFTWGYYRAHYSPTRVMWRFVTPHRMLYQSYHHFHAGEYGESKLLCERVLLKDPDNPEALYQLAAIHYLQNNAQAGDALMQRAEQLPVRSATVQRLRAQAIGLRTQAAQAAAARSAH